MWVDLSYIAPKSEIIDNQVSVETISVVDGYDDFKHQYISNLQQNNQTVLYIGDGGSDYQAIKYADFRFVIDNSSLSQLLDQDEIVYYPFQNFNQLINLINHLDLPKK